MTVLAMQQLELSSCLALVGSGSACLRLLFVNLLFYFFCSFANWQSSILAVVGIYIRLPYMNCAQKKGKRSTRTTTDSAAEPEPCDGRPVVKPEPAEPTLEPLSEVSEDDERIVAERVKALERRRRVAELLLRERRLEEDAQQVRG